MGIYLVKDSFRTKRFSTEEAIEAIKFLESLGFTDILNGGNYDGPNHQYVRLSKTGDSQVQTQELNKETIRGLVKILKPNFFLDDFAESHKISELNI